MAVRDAGRKSGSEGAMVLTECTADLAPIRRMGSRAMYWGTVGGYGGMVRGRRGGMGETSKATDTKRQKPTSLAIVGAAANSCGCRSLLAPPLRERIAL